MKPKLQINEVCFLLLEWKAPPFLKLWSWNTTPCFGDHVLYFFWGMKHLFGGWITVLFLRKFWDGVGPHFDETLPTLKFQGWSRAPVRVQKLLGRSAGLCHSTMTCYSIPCQTRIHPKYDLSMLYYVSPSNFSNEVWMRSFRIVEVYKIHLFTHMFSDDEFVGNMECDFPCTYLWLVVQCWLMLQCWKHDYRLEHACSSATSRALSQSLLL